MGLLRKLLGDEVNTSVAVHCEVTEIRVDAVVQSYTNGSTNVLCPRMDSNNYGGCTKPPKDLSEAGKVGKRYTCPYLE